MKKIILSIISILFLCNVAKSAGPSTQYSITLTKGELCEAGSTLVVTSCINPVQLNAPGSTLTVDIAATEAGATAGAFGTLANAKFGVTYTHFRSTISRLFTVNGQSDAAGSCFTVATQNGGLNAYAQLGTTANGDARGTATLSMPNTTAGGAGGMGATLGNDVIGTDANGAIGANAAGAIANADTHFMSIMVLSKPLTVKAGIIPTLKLAFGTATSTSHETGVNSNCINAATGAIAAPDVTMSFE